MSVTWIEAGGWYIAPEGYVIDDVYDAEGHKASSFTMEDAYTPDDRVIGTRWKFNNGVTREALNPVEGYWYEWYRYTPTEGNPIPPGWQAIGDKIGTNAYRYTDSGGFVEVATFYAPVHRQTEPPPPMNYNFLVTKQSDGTPIEGAVVMVFYSVPIIGLLPVTASTDSAGTCTVVTPTPGVQYLVGKSGFIAAHYEGDLPEDTLINVALAEQPVTPPPEGAELPVWVPALAIASIVAISLGIFVGATYY